MSHIQLRPTRFLIRLRDLDTLNCIGNRPGKTRGNMNPTFAYDNDSNVHSKFYTQPCVRQPTSATGNNDGMGFQESSK